MTSVRRAMRHWKPHGMVDALSLAGHLSAGVLDYYLNPWTQRQRCMSPPDHDTIAATLSRAGVTVKPYSIDLIDFQQWLDLVSFPEKYQRQCGAIFKEKALEHYVGAKLLSIQPGDVLIDVASSNSPWSEMAERAYECSAYALDLCFKRGIHGRRIGADATAMPLPDGWANGMALHCSFEMFEGTADIDLIPEAQRVLKPGGRMVILPLYLHDAYFAYSSPLSDRRGLDYQGAARVWRDDEWPVRFSRKYSVDSFVERIVSALGSMKLTVYVMQNETQVASNCYLKFAALFEKPVTGDSQ